MSNEIWPAGIFTSPTRPSSLMPPAGISKTSRVASLSLIALAALAKPKLT
jgi:hypothetical protein